MGLYLTVDIFVFIYYGVFKISGWIFLGSHTITFTNSTQLCRQADDNPDRVRGVKRLSSDSKKGPDPTWKPSFVVFEKWEFELFFGYCLTNRFLHNFKVFFDRLQANTCSDAIQMLHIFNRP